MTVTMLNDMWLQAKRSGLRSLLPSPPYIATTNGATLCVWTMFSSSWTHPLIVAAESLEVSSQTVPPSSSQQVSQQQLLLLHKQEAKKTASLQQLKRATQHRKHRLSFCSTATLQSPLIGLVTTLLTFLTFQKICLEIVTVCSFVQGFRLSIFLCSFIRNVSTLLSNLSQFGLAIMKTDGPTAFIFCLVWVVAKLRCFSIVRYAERCLPFQL